MADPQIGPDGTFLPGHTIQPGGEAEQRLRDLRIRQNSWQVDPLIKRMPSGDDASRADWYQQLYGDAALKPVYPGMIMTEQTGQDFAATIDPRNVMYYPGGVRGRSRPKPIDEQEATAFQQAQLQANQNNATYGRFDPQRTAHSTYGTTISPTGMTNAMPGHDEYGNIWVSNHPNDQWGVPRVATHELFHVNTEDLMKDPKGQLWLKKLEGHLTPRDLDNRFDVHELMSRASMQRNYGPWAELPPGMRNIDPALRDQGGRGGYQIYRTMELMQKPEVRQILQQLDRISSRKGAERTLERAGGHVYAHGGSVYRRGGKVIPYKVRSYQSGGMVPDTLGLDYPAIEHASVLPAHDERPESTHNIIDQAGGMSYRAGGRVRIPLRKFKKKTLPPSRSTATYMEDGGVIPRNPLGYPQPEVQLAQSRLPEDDPDIKKLRQARGMEQVMTQPQQGMSPNDIQMHNALKQMVKRMGHQHGGRVHKAGVIDNQLPPDHPWLANPQYRIFDGVNYGKIGRIALGNDPSAMHLQALASQYIDDDRRFSEENGLQAEFSPDMMELIEQSDEHVKQLDKVRPFGTEKMPGEFAEVPVNQHGGLITNRPGASRQTRRGRVSGPPGRARALATSRRRSVLQ